MKRERYTHLKKNIISTNDWSARGFVILLNKWYLEWVGLQANMDVSLGEKGRSCM